MKLFLPIAFLLCSFFAQSQNNSLYFDSDASVTGLSGPSPAAFTVEFWILLDHAGNQYQGVYWSANEVDERGFYIEEDNTISCWNQNVAKFNSGEALPLNTWTHVAFAYNGSALSIYFNGVLKATHNLTGLLIPSADVVMGASTSGLYGDYNMANSALDEFRIWDFAKTQAEIAAQLNTELTLPQTGLLRYYDFNHGVGGANNAGITTLADRTGNSSGGTLSGFTLSGNTSNWVGNAPALPLKLLSFQGRAQANGVELVWNTADETNVWKFEVERSINEGSFSKVGEVRALNVAEGEYRWKDRATTGGNNQYRLKMIDLDGSFVYSDILSLKLQENKTGEMVVYPVQGSLRSFNIVLPSGIEKANYDVSLFDAGGRNVFRTELTGQVQQALSVNLPAHINGGVYVLVVRSSNGKQFSKKLAVQ